MLNFTLFCLSVTCGADSWRLDMKTAGLVIKQGSCGKILQYVLGFVLRNFKLRRTVHGDLTVMSVI